MTNQDYHTRIVTHASAALAFAAISRVSDWWAKNLSGNPGAAGAIFTVRFGETFVTFEVTEFVPNQKIVWRVRDCCLHWLADKREWLGTEAEWEIQSRESSTAIDFTHRGLVPQVECYEICKKGWDFFAQESLCKLITEGQGMPD